MDGRGVVVLASCVGLWLAGCGPLEKRDADEDAGDGGVEASPLDTGTPVDHLWLAWIEEPDAVAELRLVDVNGDTSSSETLSAGVVHFEWSNDRRWLVVDRAADTSLLVAFVEDGHPTTPLTFEAQALSDCRISNDSEALLCHRGTSDDLVVVNVSGSAPSAQAVEGTGTPYDLVGWSPNGKFAVTLWVTGGDADARLVDATSLTPSVVSLSANSPQIRFSHDSHYVAYLSTGPQPGLSIRDLQTAEVWFVSGAATGFEWILGGPGLAYDDENGVHVFVPSNGATLSLAPPGVSSFEAAPDGTRLVYEDSAGTNVLLDTSSLPAAELGSIASGKPMCWSPSGRFLGLAEVSQNVVKGLLLQDLSELSSPVMKLDTGEMQNSVTWCTFVDDSLMLFMLLGGWAFYAETKYASPVLIPYAEVYTQLVSWSHDRSQLAYRTTSHSLEAAFRQPALAPIVISAGPVGQVAFQP